MEKCRQFLREQKWSLISLAAAVVLLVICSIFLAQEGLLFRGEFLRKQAENCWQGQILGEELTLTRTETEAGIVIRLEAESGVREFLVTGEPGFEKQASLYEDGELLFAGRYHSGNLLQDLDGNYHHSISTSASSDGETYIMDDSGELIPDSPLQINELHAMALAFEPEETTRGSQLAVLLAAVILITFYVELWWPQLGFHLEVGRFVSGDAEPSDEYLAKRAFGLIWTAFLFFAVLIMGFLL